MRLDGFGSSSTIVRRVAHAPPGAGAPTPLGTLRLDVPGQHSVLNALAAVGVGLELGVPFDVLAAALAAFQGAERRFERRGVVHGITVVDDYGHHPTEITAVLAAARAAAPSRVLVAFQPHRYTRTAQLMPEFAAALAAADEVGADRHLPGGRGADSRGRRRGPGCRGEPAPGAAGVGRARPRPGRAGGGGTGRAG